MAFFFVPCCCFAFPAEVLLLMIFFIFFYFLVDVERSAFVFRGYKSGTGFPLGMAIGGETCLR